MQDLSSNLKIVKALQENDKSFHNTVDDLDNLHNISYNAQNETTEKCPDDPVILKLDNLSLTANEDGIISNATNTTKTDSKSDNNYYGRNIQQMKAYRALYQQIISLLQGSDVVTVDIDKLLKDIFKEDCYIKVCLYFACYTDSVDSAKSLLEYINKYTKDSLRLLYLKDNKFSEICYETVIKNFQILLNTVKKMEQQNLQWLANEIRENVKGFNEESSNIFPKDFLEEFNNLDKNGKGLVHYAAQHCGKEVIASMIKASVNMALLTSTNTNVLSIAINTGNLQAVEIFIANKELLNIDDASWKILLQLAESKLQEINNIIEDLKLKLEDKDEIDEDMNETDSTLYDILLHGVK